MAKKTSGTDFSPFAYDPNNMAQYYDWSRSSGTRDLYSKYSKSDMLKALKKKREEEEEKKKKGSSKGQEKIDKEVDNYKKRLDNVNVKHDVDTRNAVEKFLNLKEGQNTLFDIFEIIDRPADATREFFKSGAEGEGVKKALADAFQNFKGHNDTSGKELNRAIAKKNGFDGDKLSRAADFTPVGLMTQMFEKDPEKRKKIYEAIGGFGTEVIVDPLNLVGGGLVKGGAKAITKGGKVIDNALSKSNVYVKGKEGASQVSDAVRTLFDPNKDLPYEVKALKESIEAEKGGLVHLGMKKLNHMFKNNPEIGTQVGRFLEKDLVNEPNTSDLLQDLIDLSPKSEIRVRGKLDANGNLSAGDDLNNLIKALNEKVVDSDAYKNKIKKIEDGKLRWDNEIQNITKKYKFDLPTKIGALDNHYNTNFMSMIQQGATKSELNKAVKVLSQKGATPVQVAKMKQMISDAHALEKANLKAANLQTQLDEFGQGSFRLDELTDGGQGFAIRKLDKINTAKALVDREGFLNDFGQDTIHIPRIARQLSQDPQVHQVADVMKGMQDDLLSWGQELGVNIEELDGYMRHAITEQYRNSMMKRENTGRGGTGKAVVKQRQLYGSAEDVNEMMGKEVFHTDAYKSFVDGYHKVANYIATEGFVKNILENPELAKPFNETIMKSLPLDKKGRRQLPKGKTILKLNDFDFYRSVDANGLSHLSVRPSAEYIVDKGTHDLLKRYDELIKNENIALDVFDGAMKFWKGMQLMSVGYHVRNWIGNSFNRYLSGMNVAEQSKYDFKAAWGLTEYNRNILPKIVEGREGELTSKQLKIRREVEEFYHSGLRDNSKVRDEMGTFDHEFQKLQEKIDPSNKVPTTAPEKVANGLKKGFELTAGTNYKIGNGADDVQRFGMYMWAKEKKLNISPTQAVKEAMFDYSDLTSFEREVMKRIMPFYTFTRKNLPFQIRALTMQNPVKYAHIMRGVQATYDASGSEEENIPDYLKESLGMANPFGDNEIMKLYLPMSDIANWGSPNDALETATSMLNPFIKIGPEVKTNFDTFRERPIQEYEGQKTDRYGGVVSPTMAHVLDNFGLRNPEKLTSTAFKTLTGNLDKDKSNTSELLSSLFTTYDPEQEQYFDTKKERDRLAGLVKKYEDDTGKEVKSVREIDKAPKKKSYKDYIGF